MTNEDRLLLEELKSNTRQLFEKFEESENKKKSLEKKVTELEKDIETLKREKLELVRKIENIKLAKRLFSNENEKRDARQRINKLVREIDKCIALLNK